ncbi:phosphatase PAP2 family protein [Ferruginibacter lapsinanis]|uniref:phosphatase PAP2 family protein n=1 Tax=Ferruginibacter lapsinanis TaxID=563172 RepID=UPI001E4D6C45|nr:phosphatase PAP2 family protein [Ferruginibacter lapsinanis]UEG49104.1 phosphatase PAP2 family protein [Ferruginibacter lapsinanis]
MEINRDKELQKTAAVFSLQLFITSVAIFISLCLLIVLIRQIFYYKEETIDHRVFELLAPYRTGRNTIIMEGATLLGSHKFLIPAWLLLFARSFFFDKNKWIFIKALVIAVGSLCIMFGLKYFFKRPRPLIPLLHQVQGLSFPSGHAFMGLVFFGFLICLINHEVANKKLKWVLIILLVVLILIIGLSRVYLGVHYASDVIAGYCFGVLTFLLLQWLLARIEKYSKLR